MVMKEYYRKIHCILMNSIYGSMTKCCAVFSEAKPSLLSLMVDQGIIAAHLEINAFVLL